MGGQAGSLNDTLVKMALPLDNTTILANEYKLYLPSADELVKEVDVVKAKIAGIEE